MLTRLTPTLYTKNLMATLDFYQDVLGFATDNHEEAWGWARVKRDEVELMIALPHDHVPFDQPMFTGSFYIYTDAVDGIWKELKERARVAYPLEDFDYAMREFGIYDNNGYLLQFGQELDP